jgi:hypothetical protein
METNCPLCGRYDMVEKVSDIYAAHRSVGNIQLSPPKEPLNAARILIPIIAELPLAIGIPFLISKRTEIWGVLMLVISMMNALILVNDHSLGKGIFRLTLGELQSLRRLDRWRQARVCLRDHCIFDPDSGEYTTPQDFSAWLQRL